MLIHIKPLIIDKLIKCIFLTRLKNLLALGLSVHLSVHFTKRSFNFDNRKQSNVLPILTHFNTKIILKIRQRNPYLIKYIIFGTFHKPIM